MYLKWFEVKRSEVNWSEVKWKNKTKNNNSKTETKQKQTKNNNNKQTETTHTKTWQQGTNGTAFTIYIYEESGQPKRDQTEFLLLPYLAGLHGSDLFDSLLVWFNAKVYVQGNADL